MTADAVGGVWTYAVELCRGLSERGVDVLLATMGDALRADQRAEIAAIPRVMSAESGFRLEWMEDPWDDVDRAGDWLMRLADEFEPDVVHLNGYAHGALPWAQPVVVVGHSCVLSWWKAVKGEEAPASWERYREAVYAGIQKADQVIAPSAWMLRELERYYGPLGAPRVISNARTLPPVVDVMKESFVLCVGRLWDEAKNARALALAAEGLRWPVCLVGNPQGPGGVAADFPNVRLVGHRPNSEVWDLCRRASIYALPARYEPFGLSALEAAHAGCALVLGDIPSLREIWGDAAVFVDPNSPTALREAIARLIASPSELEQRRLAAKLRARRYSVKVMTEAYLDTYAELIGDTTSAPEKMFSYS